MEPENNEPGKKTYTSPELVVYGDIRTITQANDLNGMNDNAMAGPDKT